MNNNNTKYTFTSIKDLMQQVLQKNKLQNGMHQLDVSKAWREVMGEGIWTYTTDVKFNKGNLTILLRSSTIREELSYKKNEIIIMMNSYLKTKLITKIRLI
ncbi:MAG: DUF721 domain-containing protein [Flavobacteriaceae bacterium]